MALRGSAFATDDANGSTQIGQGVHCDVIFKNSTGQNADPSAVTFKIRNLSTGAVTTYVYLTDAQLVKDATGLYHVDFIVTSAGIWSYRFAGTGAVTAPDERSFLVQRSDFA
jgi:hypothetical protein